MTTRRPSDGRGRPNTASVRSRKLDLLELADLLKIPVKDGRDRRREAVQAHLARLERRDDTWYMTEERRGTMKRARKLWAMPEVLEQLTPWDPKRSELLRRDLDHCIEALHKLKLERKGLSSRVRKLENFRDKAAELLADVAVLVENED